MVDRRALLGLIAGLAGLALGTGAVVVHLPVLAVAAAGCALLAGTASVVLLQRLQAATSHHKALVSRLAAGVASYPTHGLLSDDVLGRAQAALTRACASAQGHGLGQVEVAQADMA